MLDFLKRLLAPPPVSTSLLGLKPGKAVLEGHVYADGAIVVSPLERVECLAYFYRSWFSAPSRGRMTERALSQAEVYAPHFIFRTEDGDIPVIPPKPGAFTNEEHQRIITSGLEGLSEAEQIIHVGEHVRIHARVHSGHGGLYLEPEQIDLLSPARSPALTEGVKKKRRLKPVAPR
jgi:hypothetical protein